MKYPGVFMALLSLSIPPAASGQTAPLDPKVLNSLHKAAPTASWSDNLSAVADVACDGKADTIVVGRETNAVWLGVVQAPNGKKPGKTMVQSWPIGHPDGKDAFCAKPVRIILSPLECKGEDGKLPGCRPIKGCYAFSIYDEECDSFNFYWDSKKHSLAYWRN